MDVLELVDGLASEATGGREASVLREELYEHLGRALIFACNEDIPERLRDAFSDVTVSVFSRMPAYIHFEITRNRFQALEQSLRPNAWASVKPQVDVVTFGRAEA